MLRVIAQDNSSQPNVIPDGIYGQQTTSAISSFQRNHGLPVTGVADQNTWEAIVSEYEPALTKTVEAQPLQIILNPGEELLPGSTNPNLYVIQAVLTVLSNTWSSVTAPSFSGILDEATMASIISFQEMSGIPATGKLDKITWKHLALHYPLAANQGEILTN
jgi:peptidoglycan hydrolase-like protein with peptidoglycan-binding domain